MISYYKLKMILDYKPAKKLCLLIIILISLKSTIYAGRHHQAPDVVSVKVINYRKNCIFNGGKIKYKIRIYNTYNTEQTGTVKYEIVTAKNKKISGCIYDVKIPAKSSETIKVKFKVNNPGFFDFNTIVNLSDYDDTIKNVFGYKPKDISTALHKPDDFDKFWADTRKELEAIDPKYIVEYNQAQSSITHRVYNVAMTSLDNITIHCWLSIPRLPGKYPLMIAIPGYKQKVKPFFGEDQAIFCVLVRNANDLVKNGLLIGEEKEYCIVNIAEKNNYIYRGAIMDCVRAVDFVFSNSTIGIDTNRIILSGGSQGGALSLITASLDHRVSLCETENPVYCDFHNYYGISSTKTPNEFPYVYYKQTKIPWVKLLKTLDYFDVQNFVADIKCPCMFAIGTRDPIAPPECIYAAYNKLNEKTKRMSELNVLNIGHETTREFLALKNIWIDENIVSTNH